MEYVLVVIAAIVILLAPKAELLVRFKKWKEKSSDQEEE